MNPSPAPAVRCTEVIKDFGENDTAIRVLRGVTAEVPAGGITMLVGPSGCGKTTLISVIAGLLNRTSGHLEVLGQDIARLTPQQAVLFRRRNLGFIFQQYNLLPSLTAAENAAVPLLAAGMHEKEALEQGTAMLDRLGLKARAHALPTKLSGGQQQRVAIARALIHNPRLILCDEPTSALDADTGHAVMELLVNLAAQPGRAVIVVTHDNRIFNFAGTILEMEDGRIIRVTGQDAMRSSSTTSPQPP
jgi:putative ABC transport system ATP-binding protein